MACCLAPQRPGWAAPRTSLPPTADADAAARRSLAATWRPQNRPAVAAQAARQQQPDGSGNQAAGSDNSDSSSSAADSSSVRRRGRPSVISQHSDEEIAAGRLRLQAYLQQQGGISQAEAARLAGKLSAKLGGAADQLVPAPLQWFVGRGIQPAKAARQVARICASGTDASMLRQWLTWQPLLEANWQLADSYLAAYQRHCKAAKLKLLKGSESMAAMLSSQPSRYRLLRVQDLPGKVMALQEGQLGLSAAEVGQLIAGGAKMTGSPATMTNTIEWLVRFAGSREAAADMLGGAATIVDQKAALVDRKVAALEAAWAAVLQPGQLRQLVQRAPLVLRYDEQRYAPAAVVLCSWFPQPGELLAVLQEAPQLLGVSADILQSNERWFTGPPLRLSHREFLARVRAAPQAFLQNFADELAQRKLAFATQVGGMPLERALSASHLRYLKYSTTALAGRYFLLTQHGVPLSRHEDGGIMLSYVTQGLPTLLNSMRRHDSAARLPADDDAAVEYLRQWLAAWPESDSGLLWH